MRSTFQRDNPQRSESLPARHLLPWPGLPRSRKQFAALLLTLVTAFGLRLYLAGSTAYIVDEDSEWIPLAREISLEPGDVRLPVRDRHPALPAYFLRLGAEVFGENPMGYRIPSILASLLTILLAYRMAYAWKGPEAALWVAVLLTFNEFYLVVTSLALLDAFYMLFALAAAHFFCRFLEAERPFDLYITGLLVGLAFLTYEIAALLPVVFFVTLLLTPRRDWLKRKEPYLAAALCFVVISPDIAWNLTHAAGGDGPFDYSDQFSRAGGLGLSVQPLVFYGRDAIRALYATLGRPFGDAAAEYPAMNPLFGGILLLGVAAVALRFRRLDLFGRFFVVFFCVIFGFFVLLRSGAPRPGVDGALWFWADVTILPAALLAGHWIASQRGWMRWILRGMVALTALYAAVGVVRSQLGMPRAAVVFTPQFLQPASGAMRQVTAHVQLCSLCEVERVELASLRVRDGSRRADPAAANLDVEGADIGTDDRSFRVRATRNGEKHRIYFPIYHVIEKSGREYIIEGGRLPGVHVAPTMPGVRVPFWAEEERR